LIDDPRYAEAKWITLICDNLNTHRISSLYEAFPPAEALRIANKLELVHTPKHGSWLNMAECELSVLSRQALRRRSADSCWIRHQGQAWSDRRNTNQIGIDWQFTPEAARTKLKRLFPKIIE
jgi:transposase